MRNLISIRIDPQIWRKARELGLNISKISENALKETINRLQSSNCEEKPFLGTASFSKEGVAGGTGFEPATPSLGGSCPILARHR